jgi:D-alanyl-D-alanine carboxypeptidase/D-alanyl-D-alanine-endopeptidase (penicillin-binding protein 4)
VLAGLPPGPAPNAATIRRALAALVPGRVLGRRVGVLVVDPYTGATLLSRLGTVPLTPASTSKLLTATALVDRYGAGHRFATQVLLQPTTTTPPGTAQSNSVQPGAVPQLVLVGGGDPSLTSVATAPTGPRGPMDTSVRSPARLPALAAATAAALRDRGVPAVRVTVDDALFTGPRVNPRWPRTDVAEGFVGPVDALAVDNGRVDPFTDRRVADPARAAGTAFAALLRSDGIAVSGPVVRSTPAAGSAVLATAQSPTVAALVRHMLEDSDNDYAEVLSRQVAVGTAQPTTFAGGVTAVDDRLAALGVDLDSLTRFDGSGLSHLDRIEPATLASVVRLDLADPGLGVVLRSTAVAGRKGSLYYRMGGPHGKAAGRIVAKTGTLTRVHDLAGYVIPAGGRPLVFVFMVDTAHDDLAAEELFDDAAVALARAGPGS